MDLGRQDEAINRFIFVPHGSSPPAQQNKQQEKENREQFYTSGDGISEEFSVVPNSPIGSDFPLPLTTPSALFDFGSASQTSRNLASWFCCVGAGGGFDVFSP